MTRDDVAGSYLQSCSLGSASVLLRANPELVAPVQNTSAAAAALGLRAEGHMSAHAESRGGKGPRSAPNDAVEGLRAYLLGP